eukprot:SAG22_NODE_1614_length_3993_cov_3.572419_1_plen_342_part_00
MYDGSCAAGNQDYCHDSCDSVDCGGGHGTCRPQETYAGTCEYAAGWAGARCGTIGTRSRSHLLLPHRAPYGGEFQYSSTSIEIYGAPWRCKSAEPRCFRAKLKQPNILVSSSSKQQAASSKQQAAASARLSIFLCHRQLFLLQRISAAVGEAAPPPPPPPAPPAPAATGGGTSCTGPEFMARSQAVTAACCDDAHPCESGLPTTCTAACAEHLLPMQRDCAAMVTMMGLADVISTAAAECPEPSTPCSTGPEFMAYSQMVCTHSTQSSAVSQTAPAYLWSHSMRSATRNLNDGARCVRVCRSPRPAATMHRPRAPRGSRRQHAARRARRCCCRCRQRADRS